MQLDRCHTDLLVSKQACATRVRSNSPGRVPKEPTKSNTVRVRTPCQNKPTPEAQWIGAPEIGALSDRTRSGERESVLIRLGEVTSCLRGMRWVRCWPG
jgi:hypothetical protein